VVDRDHPALARRIQQLAESGDYEGFNAIIGTLIKENEFDTAAMDAVKADGEFRNRVTDICHEAWGRKHARPMR
jgi:hypothetical protein